MRIAFTLLLVLVVTLSASADTGRRGRWRVTPLRPWKSFEGYNVRSPGWDSSYYSPYTPNNTITTPYQTPLPSPTPITGSWQPSDTIPNTTWNNDSTQTPGSTTTPVEPSTTQYFNPQPSLNSGTGSAAPTPIPSPPGQTTSRRSATSTSFQRETPQTNYWQSLNGLKK